MSGREIPLRDRAIGHWRAMLPILGIDSKFLVNRHGPCPACGGRDRFRFDDRDGRGTWICNQCGSGDGFKLVMLVTGRDFHAVACEVERLVGVTPKTDAPERKPPDRTALQSLWDAATLVTPADPAGLWLGRRCGLSAFPPCLRYSARTLYRDDGEDGPPRYLPAMLAKVVGPDARPVNIHRTFLTEAGEKAAVRSVRKMMLGTLPAGAAVPLTPPAEEMGVAEGIESALAASALTGVPTWAALNATQLAKWEPPAAAKAVTIFADNDANYTGQSAAFALARRLAIKGILVRGVEYPPETGRDWNDILLERKAAA